MLIAIAKTLSERQMIPFHWDDDFVTLTMAGNTFGTCLYELILANCQRQLRLFGFSAQEIDDLCLKGIAPAWGDWVYTDGRIFYGLPLPFFPHDMVTVHEALQQSKHKFVPGLLIKLNVGQVFISKSQWPKYEAWLRSDWMVWPMIDSTTWYDANTNLGRGRVSIYKAVRCHNLQPRHGLLVMLGDMTMFVQEQERLKALKAALQAWFQRDDKRYKRLLFAFVEKRHHDITFTRADSLKVHNCESGTDKWLLDNNLEGVESVTGTFLLQFMDNPRIKRMIVHKLLHPT